MKDSNQSELMIKTAINKLLKGDSLTRKEAYRVMDEILSDKATEAQISAFLVALQLKGSTVEEIAGSLDAYRERITPLSIKDENAIDISGTGGDNLGTFNISTAAAFVASGAGAKVVKHGYHSVSSQCGSADVLKALGVKTELFPDQFFQVFERVGLAFIFAPRYKPVPRNFAGIRQSIGARTFIHILDPLTKPALTKRQLIGVYDQKLSRLIAEVLKEFKLFRGMVVSGDNGLDELNISGKTLVLEIVGDEIKEYEVDPEQLGLQKWPVEEIRGGDAERNKQIILDILRGKPGAPRDVTILNAAAALKVAGVVDTLEDGIQKAVTAIDSGAAMEKLEQIIELSRELNHH
ncbi:MAG: anthranilate phosphoribosyltransferase [Calditrichaeota bacterium]|nr:anthranilate phosphoribosyltransferase [Calditrichota bacterium]